MNRIKLKDLSELLAKEVQAGNGDAFIFVGEYYVSSDKYVEEVPGLFTEVKKEHESPYIIYKDEATKEKVMALNYYHFQKLTDDENEELLRLLKAEEEKKMSKGKKAKYTSSSNWSTGTVNVGGGGYYTATLNEQPIYANYREAVREEEAPVGLGNDAPEIAAAAQDNAGVTLNNDGTLTVNGAEQQRSRIREYTQYLEEQANQLFGGNRRA